VIFVRSLAVDSIRLAFSASVKSAAMTVRRFGHAKIMDGLLCFRHARICRVIERKEVLSI